MLRTRSALISPPSNPASCTLSVAHHLMDIPDETDKAFNAPTRTYVHDAKAMATTPADVKEYPDSYAFVVDMPGLKSKEIKVQVEDGNVLVISDECKREDSKEGCGHQKYRGWHPGFGIQYPCPVQAHGWILHMLNSPSARPDTQGKYLRIKRRVGKFMRKFSLSDNANTDGVSVVYQDGVLTVTVEKMPPPKPRTDFWMLRPGEPLKSPLRNPFLDFRERHFLPYIPWKKSSPFLL
ncbi:hypothetical protein Taro_020208 [Colocasia esculenta]|uniref:SHSP domain-containing protein n=1 Tax=Colocasia esculenta TaxID=4460 RepID=A0A843V1N6_COLES|nr:hypothetical protein [Colocasia esculenta]